MKIVVFSSHILLASHYETELEIIQNHLDAGDEVIQLVCNSDLPACDTNPYFNPEACVRCISKREMGAKLISKSIPSIPLINLSLHDRQRIKSLLKEFDSVEDLKKYNVDGFDIGYAVASSLISYYRDPDPGLIRNEINRYLAGTLGVYYSFINYLKENPTDRVYVFNGRLAHTKAALRACRKMGVDCYLHERGHTFNFYSLFENTSIHDLKNTRRLIEEYWHKADPELRVSRASQFFESRIQGNVTNWHAFNKDHQEELPTNWDSNKKNIAIFNSSEDEVASISDEWKNPLYENQLEGIKKILKDTQNWNDFHFYLRIHPNLKNVKNSDMEAIMKLSSANFTIIPPDSKLSTYFLVQHVDTVLTFGSTVGMEACFLGKPSILAGNTFYRTMGGTYDPNTHAELIELLQKDLQPLNKDAALKFGFFFSSYGIPYNYYVADDFVFGKFKGQTVSYINSLKLKICRFVFHNNYFEKVSEYFRIRYREKVLNRFLP
jgi:hypothetical protein